MCVMYLAVRIDDHDGRHAAKLEQFELLAKCFKYPLVGIGDNREGNLLFLPVRLELVGRIGCDGDDFCVALLKLLVILTQLRQMPAADGSPETTKHHQNQMLAGMVVVNAPRFALQVGELQIGHSLTGRVLRH